MKFLEIFEFIFRVTLLLLTMYHLLKRAYKIAKAPAFVCILTFLPALLYQLFGMETDTLSILIYDVITVMSIYLGSALGFYDRYKWWDRITHFLSGFAFVGFGMAAANLVPDLAKGAVLSFGFTFSVTLHAFWEVLEYLADCITHGNAQRWQKIHNSVNHVSPDAIQPAGLVDTMNDLICCLCGGALAVIGWWIIR